MKITINKKSELTLVQLDGRMETTNASDFEIQVHPLADESNVHLVLDCENINYISSSGLRQLLMLLKKINNNNGKLVIKNLKSEIKEIFDMTGFTPLFTIE